MQQFLFAFVLLLATMRLWAGGDDSMNHDGAFLPAPPLTDITRCMASLPVGQTSERLIVVRYLGYRCSHCVEQLTYLNQHSATLKRLGIQVLAISNDAVGKWSSLVAAHAIDTSVFSYLADENASVARSLGAERVVDDTRLDLHATFVRVNGLVRAAVYSESPYMDIARIIGLASEGAESARAPSAEFVDRYLTSKPTVTMVAGPSDGIQEPIDLDFNRSLMHGNDLWIVMGDKSGHAMAIVHNATAKQPLVRLKKDSRAYHFMWRTMGIAMGANGAFATAQNGEPGDGDPNYMFMGPTLWSSDTAVFASRNQTEERRLASHLDMLHQSPWDLGIAHDSANVYWVLDAKYPGVSRYDFRDPHEVGGTDHRDGVIRRYTETSITPAQRGRPAHVCLDKQTGWLYYVDPGAAKVHRLDTRSGKVTDTLEMPPSSAENAAEFTAVTGARFSTVISAGLVEPVGIEVVGKRLLVGDRSTGNINIYDVSDTSAALLGSIATGAKELLGITVGPDQRIWFVDRATAKVCRLDLAADNSLSASLNVSANAKGDSISFRYANNSSTTHSPRLNVRWINSRTGRATTWQPVVTEPILAGQASTVVATVPEIDTLAVHRCEIAEFSDSDVMGLNASTTVVPKGLRRVVVQDERNGTFDIREAVALTSRMGYVSIPSDVFNAVADELRSLKTALWNSGSVGEISAVDETVLMSLLGRNVDLFLIADDPLALRLEWPMAGAFFRSLGVSPLGAEQNDSLKGQRIFTGVLGDPVTAGMTLIDCQLPRLDHQRGGKYIPNMLLRPLTNSKTMMLRKGDTASGAVRHEKQTLRCIVLGINASRFMDGTQRTTILDRGLIWLEEAANPDTIATSVNDEAQPGNDGRVVMRRTGASDYHWTATDVTPFGEEYSVAEVYSLTGQRMMTLYEGPLSSAQGTFSSSNLASGCYFVIIRTMNRRLHSTFINQ